MPASLSNQIRLGFSLGWRIWTPNEVGFYAKTLAHSYFIFTILRAKFFTKKMWVVNYSIFVAAAKYLVFVEFIEFGIKTKEERTYWKKIMYISLLIRHNKYKSKVKYHPSFEKLKAMGRFFRRLQQPMRNSVMRGRLFKYFRYDAVTKFKVFRKEKELYDNQIERATNLINLKFCKTPFDKMDLNPRPEPIPVLENSDFYDKMVRRQFKFTLAKVKTLTAKKYKWFFSKTLKRVKNKKKNKKVTIAKFIFPKKRVTQPGDKNLYFPDADATTIAEVLGRHNRKREKYFKLKFKPVTTHINRQHTIIPEYMHNLPYYVDLRPKASKLDKTDKLELMNAFRSFVKKRHECTFSITGGPRKRLFRNIKRSFQGKFIVHYASLVWFWEKISRLITYMIRRLTNYKEIR